MTNLSGLTPEAHGTLQALTHFQIIRRFDEAVAAELEAHGYAELSSGKLLLTQAGSTLARPI